MTEEIREAETEEINPSAGEEETPAEKEKRAKRDFFVELVLFFVLGALIGFAAKTEANKRITIGFNDYKMKIGATQFSINKLQADFLSKQMSKPEASDENQESSEGATCTNEQ